MPANPALNVNDVVELTLTGRSALYNQMVLNRYFFRVVVAGGTLTDFLSIATLQWVNNMMTVLNVDYELRFSTAKRVVGVTMAGTPAPIYDAAVGGSPSAL